ncbi:G-type lectin S-receptor-like serine/threonine-protein kinase LECRK3 [Salvia miltiorrhiza]|uniref:G-type lectin S-receptor-like serine/threonine-protein kinase LECRK3 n=1 Tax=Salvia miltiorrhiza TaxID=226208 RepID=UPI0025ABDCDC|nr:G-type lectin S-receptor-like serine/threonine-protein kinase LECRK3 [Salvia miltiorrhiza]
MSFHSIPISIFFLLFISTASSSPPPPPPQRITQGSSLTPNTTTSSWPSPSALYAFGFFPQTTVNRSAPAVGIFLPDKTAVWTPPSPTVPDDVVALHLTAEGRLVLRRSRGRDVDVISPSAAVIASASMLDNGNFVLYDSESRIIWQSFDHPTDTLLPGQRLLPGKELISDRGGGIFRLKMQVDGNLVQYPVNTPDTDRAGGNVSLNLDSDGRLYLLNGSAPLRNITRGELPTREFVNLMRLDAGGLFRIYSLSLNPPGDWNWTRRWSSTDDACVPKGFCGANSFCVQMDTVPECRCLLGFDFIQLGNYTAGCSRAAFQWEGCPKTNGSSYEMRPVENTEWQENSYENLNTATVEDCSRACLADCNCEVAFFGDGQCRKQRLPLTYGRRSLGNSNMALLRVTTTTTTTTTNSPPAIRGKVIKRERRSGILVIAIGIAFMFTGALALSISVIYAHQRRRRISEDEGASLVEDICLQAFIFEHLSEATNGFEEELGRGASGTVFKGVLRQKAVAVKRLEKEFAQGEREFQTELKTIGKTYHRNLVRLLGYCLDGDNKLLVFEFMSNGSLADILFNKERRPSWDERMEIARDISRGILYLHQECETQIIHCDIKPQNILMDDNWCAKLSDFGLAKLLKQDQTNTHTGIRGTRGYVAPEWYQKQAITVKADVYSFGVVLLEIICCRRCVDWSRSEEEAVLEEWVHERYAAGRIGEVVGDEIEEVEERKVERMVKIGLWCVQYEPSLRPTMKKVLLMLEGTVEIPIPPSPTSFFSSI